MTEETHRPWEELERLVQAGNAADLEEFLEELPVSEVARALAHLPEDQRDLVLIVLEPADAAEVLDEIPDAQAVDLVEHLPAEQAAAIVAELPSDEQADLIGAINEESASAILLEMEPGVADDLRVLASYPVDVAGGLMVTELLRFPETATVGDVIEDLQGKADQYVDYDVQYTYVVSNENRLVGVLRLRDLILAPPHRRISELMISQPLSVRDVDDLDSLDEFFERHAFVGVPVVDASERLLGVVRRHDVEAACVDRADSDYLKSQGIVGGEELRTMPFLRRSRRRLAWLSVNVLLNILAASVIAFYQDTLSAVIALAVFLPIISDMSGCSGNQAVAVSIRELSLGLVRPGELMRVWVKEIAVGALNGLVLGVIIAGAAWLWQGNPWLGAVVGAALAVNTMVSVSIGGTVPLVLKRFNVDPALASGPVLTTVTDMCGFFLVLGLATLMLSKLTVG
jgi:magnesium transporter